MNTPQVNFKVIDLTATTGTPVDGITFVSGISQRGKFNNPDTVFNTWPAFVREHGALSSDLSSLLVKRLLEKNGRIRFNRLGHYTTISNRATLTAEYAEAMEDITDVEVEGDSNILFELPLKNPGLDGNKVQVVISAASNGQPNYFNLAINHLDEPDLNESYPNLVIPGSPLVTNSSYLRDIADASKFVNVIYHNLSAIDSPIRPINATIAYAGGTDGGALVDADIIGDSAGNNGFRAFDEFDDSYQTILVLDTISDAVHVAGAAYADMRDDLQYWIHFNTTLVDKATMIAKRNSLNLNSKNVMIYQGGLKVTNPFTSNQVDIEGLADIAALAANSDQNFGPWYDFDGPQRGTITNALGVVNNFGTRGKFQDLNELANHQINSIIYRDNVIKLWGGDTTLITPGSQNRFANVVRGTFYIKKSLRPLLEYYIKQPNDMTTWKMMYYQVKPFLDSLVDKRALFSYRWEGDQDAKSLADLLVNIPTDVQAGKYKIKLFLSFIVGMREIEVNLIITPGNITFEQADSLT